jgi:hypothetical protein
MWQGDTSEGTWELACSGFDTASYTESWHTFTGNTANATSRQKYLDRIMLYKTKYGDYTYNVDVVTEGERRFDPEIKNDIEYMLDYEEGGGYSPICIQSNVREAIKVYLSFEAYVSIKKGYEISDVRSRVYENINDYLDSIGPGDNIIFSQVERAIYNTPGILFTRRLKLKVNDGEWIDWKEEDNIGLDIREYPTLDSRNVPKYDGFSLMEV